MILTTIIAFIVGIAILATVHELGHFFAAKIFKVKVEEFGFGFPPRIWAKRKGDTLYSINAIPLGGFVKIYGDEGEGEKSVKSLENKKPWQRFIVFISGVTMNFILAWLILTLFYGFGGKAIFPGMWEHNGIINNQKIYITAVEKDTPAEKEGVKAGDVLKKINGENVYLDVTAIESIRTLAASDKKKPIKITIERDGKELEKSLLTYTGSVDSGGKKVDVQRIGVGLETHGKIQSKWYLAPVTGAVETVRLTRLTVEGIMDLFKNILTSFRITEGVVGPVGIIQMTGTAALLGLDYYILFIAVLSIALGVSNLIPLHPFDGAHIAFLAVEKVIHKPLNEKLKNAVQLTGLGLILLLIAVVTYQDLLRFGLFEWIGKVFAR